MPDERLLVAQVGLDGRRDGTLLRAAVKSNPLQRVPEPGERHDTWHIRPYAEQRVANSRR